MNLGPRRRAGAEINLTPLIDILFIVLLFLVLTATFSERAVVRISLPRATTGETLGNVPDRLQVLVDADGELYLDGRVRTLGDIEQRLRAVPDKDRAVVTVSADEDARHGRVIEVIDLVRQVGISRLDIETLR